MAFEKITNLDELIEDVSIIEYLKSLNNAELPTNVEVSSFNMHCILPNHTHDPDSKTFVVYPQNNRCKCMSPNQTDNSDKPLSVWDLCQEVEGLNFRDAVYRVCEVCGVDDLIEVELGAAVKKQQPELAQNIDKVQKQIEPDELFDKTVQRLQFASDTDRPINWLEEHFGCDDYCIKTQIEKSGVLSNLAYDPAHDSVVVIERNSAGDIVNTRHQEKHVYDPQANMLNKEERMAGKWFHAMGQPTVPYHLSLPNAEEPVLIVEGVKDRIVAQLFGLNFLAINSAATKLKVDDQLKKLSGRKCILYPDADHAGDVMATHVKTLMGEVGSELYIVPWAEVIDEQHLKSGFDVAEFASLYSLQTPKILAPDWLKHRKSMRKFGAVKVDPNGPLKTDEQKLDSYVNKDFMPLKKHAVSMLCAPGGTGKSFLVLMALMRFVIDQQKPVLYVSAEEDAEDINDRVKHIIQVTWKLEDDERIAAEQAIEDLLDMMPKGSGFGALRNASKPGYEVDADKLQDLKLIMSGVDLLVLDPLISFYGGRENDNGEARIFMDTLNGLATQTQTTVLLVHHSSKGKEDTTKSRGASAFIDAARLSYSLQKVEEPEDEKKAREKAANKTGIFRDINKYRSLCLIKTNSNIAEVITRHSKLYHAVSLGSDQLQVQIKLW